MIKFISVLTVLMGDLRCVSGSLLGCLLTWHAWGPGFPPAWEGKERFAMGLKVKRNDWPILESSDNFVCINFESLVESDI